MSLADQIRDDLAEFTASEISTEILLISPEGVEFTVPGIHSKHNWGINTEGMRVNSKQVAVEFSEKNCTQSIRTNGEVNLKEWRARAKDSTGILKKYKVKNWFPDESVGFVTVILTISDD